MKCPSLRELIEVNLTLQLETVIIYTVQLLLAKKKKAFWIASTIFWSSQLHACCVCDTLQTSKNASKLNQCVVEKLLSLVKTCRRPINQHFSGEVWCSASDLTYLFNC